MKNYNSPPFAPSLMESVRAIGYTTEAAIADIIDNSITAKATKIDIYFSIDQDPYVAIVDDGMGMDFDTLKRSMVYGSTNSSLERDEMDLGRYGLGMKTASLSQAKKLVVMSKSDNVFSCFSWDLDHINEVKTWDLMSYNKKECKTYPHFDELEMKSQGTVVLWLNLDKIVSGSNNYSRTLSKKFYTIRDHISLTFHRFLSGEQGLKKILISINNNPINAYDPFFIEKSTKHIVEKVNIKYYTGKIRKTALLEIVPYTLPHLSQLSKEDINLLGGSEGLNKNQGFYLYRNKRLIMYANWFGLTRKTDLTKLCRVKVDIPNSVDHMWSLDIKKSIAIPPDIVIDTMKRIIGQIAYFGKRVYTARAKKEIGDSVSRVWGRAITRSGSVYLINRSHPLISRLLQTYDDNFESVLSLIESEIPINQILTDSHDDEKFAMENLEEKTEKIIKIMNELLIQIDKINRKTFFYDLIKVSPFNEYILEEDMFKEVIINE